MGAGREGQRDCDRVMRFICAAATFITLSTDAVLADDFYKDKVISIIVSTGASGSYDGAARTLARFMPKYIPGQPSIVVKNMPGGGHTLATNFIVNNSPQDGTTIGNIGNSIPMHQMVDGRGVRFDVAKFHWLGSMGLSNLALYFWHETGLKSIDAAFEREITMGATGAGSGTFLYPNAMNKLLGTKFKIITGYRTGTEVDLALPRGETQGRAGVSYSNIAQLHPDWLREGKLNIVAQIGLVRDATMKDAPLIHELAKSEEARQVLRFISSPGAAGRPYFAPPGVPAERVAILRKAFDAVMADKEFVAEGEKQVLDIVPLTAADVEKIVQETVKTPPGILEKVRAIVKTDGE